MYRLLLTVLLSLALANEQSNEESKRPKALIVTTGLSRSLLIFYGTVAEALASNGFEVTQLIMAAIPQARDYVAPKGTKAVIVDVDPDKNYAGLFELGGDDATYNEQELSPKTFYDFLDFTKNGTINLLKQRNVLDRLTAEKFDIGFANMCHFGPGGILELVGIKSTVLLTSGGFTEQFYWLMGVPSPWSYVPGDMSTFSDRMTLKERLINAFSHFGFLYAYLGLLLPAEQGAFDLTYGHFPDLKGLSANYQLAMVNAEEILELPRPTLHKIIYIGGLGMDSRSIKPLSKVVT